MNAVGSIRSPRIRVPARRAADGEPLPDAVRRDAEQILGADLSDVRIHVGPEPRRFRALAFTMGSHVYFAPGQYDPWTPQGRALLGHELAHVVQQRTGRARNDLGYGIAIVRSPGLEAEATRIGERLAAVEPIDPAARVRSQRDAPPVIQRARAIQWGDPSASLDTLEQISTKVCKHDPASLEVQGMGIGRDVVITANFPDKIADLAGYRTPRDVAVAIKLNPQYVAGLDSVKGANSAALCAPKVLNTGALVILKGTDTVELHAEQLLLLVLAYMLRSGEVPPQVRIRGYRVPCQTCSAVFRAYNTALLIAGYECSVTYPLDEGKQYAQNKLPLGTIFSNEPMGRFRDFVTQYETLSAQVPTNEKK